MNVLACRPYVVELDENGNEIFSTVKLEMIDNIYCIEDFGIPVRISDSTANLISKGFDKKNHKEIMTECPVINALTLGYDTVTGEYSEISGLFFMQDELRIEKMYDFHTHKFQSNIDNALAVTQGFDEKGMWVKRLYIIRNG